jgi:hypothetical protein
MSKLGMTLVLGSIAVTASAFVGYVSLQPTSPGTKEAGNINISGNLIGAKVMAGLSSSTSIITGYTSDPSICAIQGSGKNYGMRGQASATTGQAYGGLFESSSPDGYGIWARNKATLGLAYGGFFETNSSNPNSAAGFFNAKGDAGPVTAIRAEIGTNGNDQSKGIVAVGRTGYALYAYAGNGTGYGTLSVGNAVGLTATGINGYGVVGQSTNQNSSGVKGVVTSGGSGYAVFADGPFGASGTKSLVIDHPDDPQNKYLIQYCSEGDTPQLQYRGTATLDGSGSALIHLPSYFDQINRDPSYQLTAVGAAMPNLHISEEEHNNQFRIAGGKPGAKVSWMVIGIRNDLYVQRYGAPTERPKPEENRGTYLRPELYGKPEQMKEGYSEKAALPEGVVSQRLGATPR